MKCLRSPFLLSSALIVVAALGAAPAFALGGGLPDFTALVRQNGPAVVNISTTAPQEESTADNSRDGPQFGMPNLPEDHPLNDLFRRFFGDQMPEGPQGMLPQSSLGSGFIVSKDGYVISNYHVVKGAGEIVVRLSDRRELKAEVVGSDPRTDIAVLKLKAEGDLPVVRLGRSEALQVGEWVLAIGSPFGFDHSVTAGIVSAKGRSLPNENYVPFIQTDVAINPGNSGGPLFNLDGEVVGVNSQIYSRTGGFMGLSFAIPIDVVMNVYKQLRETGSVSRGWLGVLIQDVTGELAESFKMKMPHGALVSKVLPDSPAAKAGIEAGDVITRFDGKDIATSSDLPPMVGATRVGQKIEVEVIRGGSQRSLVITIGKLPEEDQQAEAEPAPKAPNGSTEIAKLKIAVRELTKSEREGLELKGRGVLVEKVKAGPAAAAGLQPMDVVVQLNFEAVDSVEALKAAVGKLAPGTKVPMLVQREGSPMFLALEVPKS
ncbi:MAG TPA: DegQ family serine endoprotease [Gammaproteobacteria bacterium]|nr:DegQ family serine endoprotease [Gammaproteobacteria bacterium]